MKKILLTFMVFASFNAYSCFYPPDEVHPVINEEISYFALPNPEEPSTILKYLVSIKVPVKLGKHKFTDYELSAGEKLNMVRVPIQYKLENNLAIASFFVYPKSSPKVTVYYGGGGSCGPEKTVEIKIK